MDAEFYRRVVIVVLLVALGAALWQMLQPMLGALSWGLCLAFLLNPLQVGLTSRLRGRSSLAAGLLTALTPLLLLLPLASLGVVFVDQVGQLLELLRTLDLSRDAAWLARLERQPLVADVIAFIRRNSVVSPADLQVWLVGGFQNLLQKLASAGGSMLLGAFGTLLSFFLMLFLLFFLLRDGTTMLQRSVRLVPIAATRRDDLLHLLANTTRAVVFGTVATALLQGFLIGVAFAILGLPSPVVFGALAALCALLPAGGTALIWVPAVLWLAFAGRYGAATFLGIWGAIVAITDNFLRPILIGQHAPVSTLAVFMGVVGGVSAFGAIGLILGPVLLTLVVALLRFADESLPHQD